MPYTEELNNSAAGRELGMAPPVASALLAKLEKALGADLLRRTTRKVSLSLEGADFLPKKCWPKKMQRSQPWGW